MTTINIFIVSTEKPEEVAKDIEEHREEITKAAEEALAVRAEAEEEEDDGWDTEQEDLLLAGELARCHMEEARLWAAEKELASIRAQEEAEEAKKEVEEAENNYKWQSEELFNHFEELDKKKRKTN